MKSGVGKLSKFLKVLFLMLMSICVGNKVFASDNVLQAIQVNGTKDSYNIVLKSDDVAELKKTVQAPNKMIINLKGIRASKTINTIYNNTSNVDSVVVEPINDETVKILIQGENVANAEVNFDTLKTPLGVLDNSTQQSKPSGEVVLSNPMSSYKPVYSDNSNEEQTDSSFMAIVAKLLKSKKVTGLATCFGIALLVFSGLKAIKGNDNEIKVGLSQSLNQNAINQQRELDLYRGGLNLGGRYTGVNAEISSDIPSMAPSSVGLTNMSSANYGVRAYQQGTKSPYLSSEIQRPRPAAASAKPSLSSQQAANIALKSAMQATMPKPAATPSTTRPKTANIDSMKFLESMTKIYEKNGRSDLAQGLKTNMKKAKVNLA